MRPEVQDDEIFKLTTPSFNYIIYTVDYSTVSAKSWPILELQLNVFCEYILVSNDKTPTLFLQRANIFNIFAVIVNYIFSLQNIETVPVH